MTADLIIMKRPTLGPMERAARRATGYCQTHVFDGTIMASKEWFQSYSECLIEEALLQAGVCPLQAVLLPGHKQ